MKLNEVFNTRPNIVSAESDFSEHFTTIIQVNDKRYEIDIYPMSLSDLAEDIIDDGGEFPQELWNHGDMVTTCEFSLQIPSRQSSNVTRTRELTGTGDEFKVIGGVTQVLNRLMHMHGANVLHFSTKKGEHSRTKLYGHIVKRMAPNNKLIRVRTQTDVHYFVLL